MCEEKQWLIQNVSIVLCSWRKMALGKMVFSWRTHVQLYISPNGEALSVQGFLKIQILKLAVVPILMMMLKLDTNGIHVICFLIAEGLNLLKLFWHRVIFFHAQREMIISQRREFACQAFFLFFFDQLVLLNAS